MKEGREKQGCVPGFPHRDVRCRSGGQGGGASSVGPLYSFCMKQWCEAHKYKGDICWQWDPKNPANKEK